MNDVLAWLEASALGRAMRDAGVWSYGIVNLTHLLGISTLFGSVLLVDLRLLGCWRRIPLAALSAPALPLAKAGFLVAAVSGLCLIATNATEYAGNPFLLIKFPAIAVGLLNAVLVTRRSEWKEHGVRELMPAERRRLAIAGGVSLASWFTALAAGRLIGYW